MMTSLASGAQSNKRFPYQTPRLRRVKKTVNFDAAEVYTSITGRIGTRGSVHDLFSPFPVRGASRWRGRGQRGRPCVPKGSLPSGRTVWQHLNVKQHQTRNPFGENRLPL